VELPYVASVYEMVKGRETKALPKGLSGKDVSGGSSTKVSLVSEIEGRNCVDVTKDSNTDFGFNVMASPADKVTGFNSCAATLRIPQGVTSIGLEARVLGYRYLDRMESNSKDRDDMWSYGVLNLPREVSGFGASTDGYVKNGVMFNEGCIDVSKLTENGPHDFSINLVAGNTGRRDAYAVGFWVKSGCRGDLKVEKAEFGMENSRGYKVLKPIKHSPEGRPNYSGAYISLPKYADPNAWGIPVEVEYKPKNAVIDEVRLVMVGSFGEREVDIKGQAIIDGKGGVKFKNLSIPDSLVPQPFHGDVQFFVVLRGTVDGVNQTTQRYPVNIKGEGDKSFIPLFNAENMFDDDRRYGQDYKDAGGDSWATWGTLNWLRQNKYRFNDISAQHVAQRLEKGFEGRSVLGHGGHSDGDQLDLRYADGVGGYEDRMGGIENGIYIRRVLEAAEKDVYERRLLSSSNISKAVNWILENRKLIEREAIAARVIYIGDTWMAAALYRGVFPSGKPILFSGDGEVNSVVPKWEDMPKNVKSISNHLHHWHISRTR
jgi:hypothetical protein